MMKVTRSYRTGWPFVFAAAVLMTLGAGAVWSESSGDGSPTSRSSAKEVHALAPGDSANGLIYAHDPTPDECTTTHAGVDVLVDYSFTSAPKVDLVEFLNGTELGLYDLSFFFTDLNMTDKFLNFESDFAFTEPDTNYTFKWVMVFYDGATPVAQYVIKRNCTRDTASLREVFPAVPSIPGPALWAFALLLVGAGIALLRGRQ